MKNHVFWCIISGILMAFGVTLPLGIILLLYTLYDKWKQPLKVVVPDNPEKLRLDREEELNNPKYIKQQRLYR